LKFRKHHHSLTGTVEMSMGRINCSSMPEVFVPVFWWIYGIADWHLRWNVRIFENVLRIASVSWPNGCCAQVWIFLVLH
jgi:hypothetical protein